MGQAFRADLALRQIVGVLSDCIEHAGAGTQLLTDVAVQCRGQGGEAIGLPLFDLPVVSIKLSPKQRTDNEQRRCADGDNA
ncbi:hypothetical protein [Zoogloea oleivorans]|uniref:hypothetical protein n=1 Tax=Zoogloea oleivorans TaxID=1552750 RepID=UPI001CA3223B|nr:hypothetical protein [Zoogloea oleivorans]